MIWIAKFTFLLLCMFFSMSFGLNLGKKECSNAVRWVFVTLMFLTGIIAVVLK